MIIIIGMDNTGKTTLAQTISTEMNHEIRKSIGPASQQDQIEWFNKQVSDQIQNVVYDRFVLFEEMIYGNVLRGRSNFDLQDQYFKELKGKDPIIIYARPSMEDIFNFGDREQMTGVIENRIKLLDSYDNLALNLLKDDWIVIFYDFRKVEDFIDTLKKEIGGNYYA